MELCDSLFQRSHVFRSLLVRHLEFFLSLVVGQADSPLPAPTSRHRELQRAGLVAVREWHSKFGPAYRRLQLGYTALEARVDWGQLCLKTDPGLVRRREQEERREEARRRRVEKAREEVRKVEEELEVGEAEMERVGRQSEALCSLLEGEEGEGLMPHYREEGEGLLREVERSLAPRAEGWLVALTRAGTACSPQLMARAQEARDLLARVRERLEGLGLAPDREVRVRARTELDPTTWGATVKKVTGEELDLELDFNRAREERAAPEAKQEDYPGEAGSSMSSAIPRLVSGFTR